jgi:hypothetical protein
MTKSILLATAALTLSSAIAFAQNTPVMPAKAKHARHERLSTVKPLYDYVPAHSSYGNTPIMFGVAY